MRSIEINLASDPFRNDVPLASLLTALALLAFGLAGWNTHAYITARARRTQLLDQQVGHRERMNAMKSEAERLRGALARVDDKQLASQAEFVAGVLDQRNFSWTRLFNALEDVTPWDTRLVAIRPVFQQGRVDLELVGVSQNIEAFLDFQTALLHAPQFRRVVPGDFQRVEPERGISFHIQVTYRPEVPPSATRQASTKAGAKAQAGRQELPAPPEQSAAASPTPEPRAKAAPGKPLPGPTPNSVGEAQTLGATAPEPSAPAPVARQVVPAGTALNKVRSAEAPQLAPDRIGPQPVPGAVSPRPFPQMRINPNAPRGGPPPIVRPGDDRVPDGTGGRP